MSQNDQGDASQRIERSQLLPHNRRLRHLHGISLRNLTLGSNTQRPRGKTIDDEALPQTFASPRRLRLIEEEKRLTHSHSSGDLRHLQTQQEAIEDVDDASSTTTTASPKRPQAARLRRRSTLDWTSGSQSERQERFHRAIARHTADVFFSLHVRGLEQPIYVSETASNSMNVDFRYFDLNTCHPLIRRMERLTVKFWTKREADKQWQCLLDCNLSLRSLHHVGRTLEHVNESFAENTVVFHASDGLYMALEDTPLPSLRGQSPLPKSSSNALPTEPTSSYDAIMRLSTLETCIDDALHTRNTLIRDISRLVDSSSSSSTGQFKDPGALELSRDALNKARRAVEACRRSIRNTQASISSQRASLASRRSVMESSRSSQEHEATRMASVESDFSSRRADVTHASVEITNQRRRIASELQVIYPIEPVAPDAKSASRAGNVGAFAIRGLTLPSNSEFGSYPSSQTASASAALGFVAHLTRMLSLYLGVPLPYPLITRSSASSVEDPISLMPPTAKPIPGQRMFPLSLTSSSLGSSSFYRFEYAVYLLNKDIEALVNRSQAQGSSTLGSGRGPIDIRQTLPNLGVLLFGLAGGERSELPARVQGSAARGLAGHLAGLRRVVAGLPRGNVGDTDGGSSVASRDSSLSREGLSGGGGNLRDAALGWKGKTRAGENGGVVVAPTAALQS